MNRPLRVLCVEDVPLDYELVVQALRAEGLLGESTRVEDEASLRAELATGGYDVILSDYTLRGFDGMAALWVYRESGADIPFIMVTGSLGEEVAVEVMRSGAADFVVKESLKRLGGAIVRAVREFDERRENRRLQVRLADAQRLEAIGRLAGGMAHDFNNTLTAIMGAAGMVEMLVPPEHRARKHLEQLQQAVEHGATLTRQLLAFSRRQVVEPRSVDVGALAVRVRPMLDRLVEDRVELRIAREPGTMPVRIDPGQLEQVVVNLVINARDAMPEGGTVSIDVRSRDGQPDKGEPAGHVTELSVADTGTGMDEATRARCFEPLFTTKGSGAGTGLGLATVQTIVQQAGGVVTVESASGHGTLFRVVLPVVGEAPRQIVERKPIGGEHHYGGLALVVEDEELVRSVLVTMLREAGFEPLGAATAAAGLRIAQENPGDIRLIVTDSGLPDAQGGEVIRRVRGSSPRAAAVLISGYTEAEVLKGPMADATVRFLPKPFFPADLLAAIDAALVAGPATTGT
ncbi:MAG: response regulator [Phycisphaerales bacterium]